LVQTLKSLLYQDYPATMFEVIVVDNNSSDNTRELVKDFIQTHAMN
jgi:glycosyltransferase involved in cell wall biosynthesis